MSSETPTQPTATPARASTNFRRVVFSFQRWWLEDVVATVDQDAVIKKRRAECPLSARYLFMTAMSGGIAVLGLLLSSPAVVIGAMLLSPLMDPIMGIGFALATGDYRWLRQSAATLAWGTLMAVGLCAVVVFLSPLTDITSEIAARTRPNLFDLLVALFSALAGAYAMIRGRDGTIVGVAIATALMPPLAVVGFGLATFNWTVFFGALLLFVTNAVTIALTAWGMARIYGFRTALNDKQTMFQSAAVVAVFVALAIPLGISLVDIGREARATQQIRTALTDTFGPSARLSQPEINFDGEPITVAVYAWTTSIVADAEEDVEKALEKELGEPVDVLLKQFLVQDERSAEQAQIASANAQEEAAETDRVDDLAQRLMLAAGVSDGEVVIDAQRRRAIVKAKPLEGATLATYRALEQRIAASEPEWRIELTPPASALASAPAIPEITLNEEGAISDEGMAALDYAAWGAQRLELPLRISGNAEALAAAQAHLKKRGVEAEFEERNGADDMRASWGEE
ncbi:MAG: DUF389 domain-containing protein [Erythrobacter sp.]